MIHTCCMETLNAASLTPVSVLSDRRAEPRKSPSLPSTPHLNKLNKPKASTPSPSFSQVLSTGGIVLSSVLTGLAKALTYEEALGLGESASNSASESVSDIDVGGFVDSVIGFGTENPAVVIGGVTILAVPLVFSQIFKKSDKAWGVETAKNAYAKLGEGDAQLLDIRMPVDIREMGGPDVRGLKKKAVSVVYKGDDKLGFLKKLSLKFKEPENTTLFIIDKFDGNSELVAEFLTANGYKAAYAIKDGAEGPRGWMNSGLPWIAPKKTLSFDFGNLSESLSDALGEGSALPVALGLAAAGGLSAIAFTEIETILQLLGSAAVVQLLGKKLLYAEDRKQTLLQVDEFLNTKIAPKELVDEIKQIGIALLPITPEKKALPAAAPAEAPAAVQADIAPPTTSESKVEEIPEPTVEPKTAEVNSVAQAEVKAESLPGLPYSLSPYPQYPDLKPPTSPTPSKPVSEVAKPPQDVKVEAEPPQEVKVEAEPPQEVTAAAEPPQEVKVEAEPPQEVKVEAEPPQEVTAAAEPPQEVKAEAEPLQEVMAVADPVEVNSTPKDEVKEESLAGLPYALSPFPQYPDFKPPASPSPSQP